MADPGQDPLIGTRIREYEVLQLLGKGGMGSVYRARHVYLDEERAIKVVQAGPEDAGFVERFIREAKILTRLRHPNLVQLYEFGTLESNSFFMVLELIRGESVLQRIRKLGKIPIQDAIKIIREAASGLHCAHQQGIIHRDMSPDNLVLTRDRDAEITKVIDFGIAKPLVDTFAPNITSSHLFIGKPEYCSPEQCGLLEEGESLDARADIYSLGITFYQMVTGSLPFYARNAQGYFLKHANETVRPPSAHNPFDRFPKGLDALILKALSKKRGERQSSMEEFMRELDAVSTGRPPSLGFSLEPRAGEMFASRYRIESKIGHGEMGTIYKAVDKILEIPVALKTVSIDITEDEKTLERFKREVILARKVSHPNVCRVYDIGESEGIHYVSMELVEGKTLAEWMRTQGRLTIESGIPVLKQVLQALKETHGAGIIHRDLKPQNIMVDTNMRPRIMDFGISISSDVHRITQTGALLGTPHYMAPELFEGKKIDQRADLYSIGVMMYALFTGRLPFDAPTPVAVIYAHLKSDPPKPSEIVPAFPAELERIILKALQKEPENRYQTADQLLQELSPFCEPATAPRPLGEEQLSHKLLAEQRYSQAIKLLHTLVKKQPDNPHWKKLLKNAVSAKMKRDLRRFRFLIHKKNLMQAQFILDRLNRSKPEGTVILKQMQKLSDRLAQAKDQAIRNYLLEAEELRKQKDFLAAMACLESAWHLRPNDPTIIDFQERIQASQEEEILLSFQPRFDEARNLSSDGQHEQALTVLKRILEDYPAHKPAKDLRDQILETRWNNAQARITHDLELAIQPLSFCDFELASQLISKLEDEPDIQPWRPEIQRMRKGVDSLAAVFAREEYQKVPHIAKQLLQHDRFGWLQPYEQVFSRVQEIAMEQLQLKEKTLVDALTDVRSLYQSGDYHSAFDRLDVILHQQPGQTDAHALREEIRHTFREQKLQQAQLAADRLEWESAIQSWKEILTLYPDDNKLEELVVSTEEHLQAEYRLQQQLLSNLKECHRLILKERWQETNKMLESTMNQIRPGFRLIEFEDHIDRLQRVVSQRIQTDEQRLEIIASNLSEATVLYHQKAYEQALQKLALVLQEDPAEENALELKKTIERALQEKQIQQRFEAAFVKGKHHFNQKYWQKAIDFWTKALALMEDAHVRTWMNEAQKNLKRERQARRTIAVTLAEAHELIFYKNFVDARQRLDKCRKAIEQDSALSDFQAQIRLLSDKLNEQIAKENSFRDKLHATVEEAVRLYQNKYYREALQKLDSLLEQQPEMETAMKLRAEIEEHERLNQKVLDLTDVAVKLLMKKRFKEMPAILLQLRTASRNTPYAEDAASIVDELPLFVLEVEGRNIEAARNRLQRLFSRSLVLLQYEQQITGLLTSIQEEHQKETELEAIAEEGMQHLQQGERKGTTNCLLKMMETSVGTNEMDSRPAVRPDFTDKTVTISDPDLRLSESELESVDQHFLQTQLAELLAVAEQMLASGNIDQAREMYHRALQIEPQNSIALEAMRKLN